MKKSILTYIFLIAYTANAHSEISCDAVRDVPEIHYMHGFRLLSDFWADEVTGIDLVESERKAIKNQLTPSEVYVCDSDEDNHMNLVRGIVDRALRIYPSKAVCHQSSDGKSHNPEVFARSLLEAERHSSITNLSMSYGVNGISDQISHLNRSILIQASGNDWSKGSPLLKLTTNNFINTLDDPQILVGAMGPDGIATQYSQEGKKVSILAPVGNYEYTTCSTKPCTSLSGTSFAAPQVTYMFKVVRELLPEISKKSLLKIMNLSATPTYHSVFEQPQMNGVGLLNGYKMWRMSLKIKDKCKSSTNTSECIQAQLKAHDISKFEKKYDHSTLFNQNFPSCGASEFQGLSCEEKKSKFNNLRKNFLLDTKNDTLRRSLQCAYSDLGYKHNGILYGNLSPEADNNIMRFNSQSPKALRFKNSSQQESYTATMSHSIRHNKAVLTQLSLMGLKGLQLLLKHGDRSNLVIGVQDESEVHLGEYLKDSIENESKDSLQQALVLINDHPTIVQQYFMFFNGFSKKLTHKQRGQIGQILALGSRVETKKVGYDMIYWSLMLEFNQELFNFYKNGVNEEDRWTRINVEDGIVRLKENIN